MGLKPRGGLIATALVITAAAAPSAHAFVEVPGGHVHVAAIAAAVQANAKSVELNGHPTSTFPSVGPNPDEQSLGSKPAQAAQIKASKIASTPATSTVPDSPGFQYDDAAIGAGVMVGLVLLGTAGTVAARRRGEPRPS